MKTTQEIKQKAHDEILTTTKEVVVEIDKITDYIKSRELNQLTGDEISRAFGKLAVLLSSLGDITSEAVLMANSSYIYRKWKYYHEFSGLREEMKGTVSDSEAQANKLVGKEFEEQLINAYIADYLKTKYQSTKILIEALRSRLSWIKNDREQSKHINLDD